MSKRSNAGTWMAIIGVLGGLWLAGSLAGGGADEGNRSETAARTTPAETYRLIHAIGNDETEVARDLSRRECDTLKEDRIAIAEALGIHSERLGVGSITCLPESVFEN